uniref:Branched-chain-amino-acid aminotransferase n=1 Tax=Setaria italica TaxID=4555 RepID=K4AAU2_SETIT
MAASLSSAAKGALLPWARGGHGGLARVLLGGALLTAGGGGGSCPRRWQSSLPQLDHTDRSDEESCGEIDWDNLGFGLTPTDYMYVMRSSPEDLGGFPRGELCRYGNIELSPSSGVLNYAQGLFEGMKAYRRPGRAGYTLFRPEENARRMQHGAERMCMPAPSVDQFVRAVKETVLANRRWGKGALYLRPLLMGSGPILGLAPAPEYTFLIYAAPVGNYFKEGLAPINLVVDDEFHRAMPGGTGGVKTIANYAPVLRAQLDAKSKGFTDVLYLDSVHKRYLEEVSSCNVFVVKGGVVATPATMGTILPGITRKSVIELARDRGYKVEERLVSIDDLIDADEVFCTGTAVVVAPVSTVTYKGQRHAFRTGSDTLAQELYTTLTSIQMGLTEDNKGWTVAVD